MPVDWTSNPPRDEMLKLVREALRMNEVSVEVAEAVVDTVLHNFVAARIKPFKGNVEVVAEQGGYAVILGHDRWFIHEQDLGDLTFDGQKSLNHVAATISKQRAAMRAARAEQAKKRTYR